jgi:hypothetical protein
MKMQVAAADFEGSGSLQYLRPELFTAKEIRIVMREWTPYVALSNTMMFPAKLIMASANLLENQFEARQNLRSIRMNIRSTEGLIRPDDVSVAEAALKRLRAREAESIQDWADKLSRDISAQDD